MKRILILAIIGLFAAGCGKQNAEPENRVDERLVGTTYRTDGVKMMEVIWGYYYHLFDFDTATSGVAYFADRKGGQNGSDGDFTYRLDYPELYITREDGKVEHYRFLDSRTFVLIKDDGEPNTMFTYYKQ